MIATPELNRTELAHPVLRHHAARKFGRFLEVVAGAGRNVAKLNLFCKAAAERHRDLRDQFFARNAMTIVLRQRPGETERHASRNDRYLMHGITLFKHPAEDSVPRFVV